jgi:hypothetical protein
MISYLVELKVTATETCVIRKLFARATEIHRARWIPAPQAMMQIMLLAFFTKRLLVNSNDSREIRSIFA